MRPFGRDQEIDGVSRRLHQTEGTGYLYVGQVVCRMSHESPDNSSRWNNQTCPEEVELLNQTREALEIL